MKKYWTGFYKDLIIAVSLISALKVDFCALMGYNWVHFAQLEEIIICKQVTGFFLVFLKGFSWEINLWVTLGDFAVKELKFGKEICF